MDRCYLPEKMVPVAAAADLDAADDLMALDGANSWDPRSLAAASTCPE